MFRFNDPSEAARLREEMKLVGMGTKVNCISIVIYKYFTLYHLTQSDSFLMVYPVVLVASCQCDSLLMVYLVVLGASCHC